MWALQPGQAGGFLCLQEGKIRRERREEGRSKALPLRASEHGLGRGSL